MLAQMHLIRRFEEAAGSGYNRAEIGGFLHLGIGEEACIVGSVAALEQQDYLLCTYRSHGHAIARGTAPGQVMAELYGKQAGTSGGRGGSMHIYDGSRRFLGGLFKEAAGSSTQALVVADHALPEELADAPLTAQIALGD